MDQEDWLIVVYYDGLNHSLGVDGQTGHHAVDRFGGILRRDLAESRVLVLNLHDHVADPFLVEGGEGEDVPQFYFGLVRG